MSKARPCPTCRGVRLFRVRLSAQKNADGRRVRVLACSACETESPIPAAERPGISCPKCENQLFRVVYIRYRVGGVVRVKQCASPRCGHKVRTYEKVEAMRA